MIRKSKPEDIPEIMNIIRDAQASMKLLGISQWQNGYPNENSFAKDIAEGISHVYEEDGEIVATAAIFTAPEPDYGKIYDGTFSGKLVDGNGTTGELLSKNGIKIFNEDEIDLLLEEINKTK